MRMFATALFLLSFATGAGAQPAAGADAARAAVLKDLVACRGMTGEAERLACFDAAAERLDAAERSGEVVVLDREQVRTAKREAFGLALPSFSLFDRDERQRTEEVDRLESTVVSASLGQRGWVVALANKQVWSQTDGRRMSGVRPGAKVELSRGVLGSYFMSVNGQTAVRAERTR